MATNFRPKPKTVKEQKTDLVQLCNIAAEQMGWKSQGIWVDIKRQHGGHDSLTTMSLAQLQAVLDHARACGWRIRHKPKSTTKTKAAKTKAPSRALDVSAMASMVRGIWLELHKMGEVRDPNESALAKWVKRQTEIDALDWVPAERMEPLVEAIKKWRLRTLKTKGVFFCPGTGEVHKLLDKDMRDWLAQLSPEGVYVGKVCRCCISARPLEWRRT